MTITAAIVLFMVIWFLALLVLLPLRIHTQGEAGAVVRGTPSSAPVDPRVGRKMFWATVATLVIWAPLCALILWGGISVRDLDFWGRM